MDVYMVTLYSTGEVWHRFVAVSTKAAFNALKRGYGMDPEVHMPEDTPWDARSTTDPSQTAAIRPLTLVEE